LPIEVTRKVRTIKDYVPTVAQYRDMFNCGNILDARAQRLESEIIEHMLNSLPVEISFVDENDEVSYFNKNGDRIFPRPRSVLGKKVQQCHPKKSLNKVIEIVKAFKNGKRDVANFLINLNGRLIYIRYFAVRNKEGNYLGTLEVSQDITELKKIEGEKRLLDWK
jgi:PAS domain S-box-containing protein